MTMKLLFIAILVAGVAAAQDWKPLFDGKSRAGWEVHGPGGEWSIKDGALACAATKPSWIGTRDSFSNYVLELDFRGSDKVNSGVFLRSQKEGAPHITGYELQIWDYQPAGYNTGSLVESLKASPTKIRGDQWNHYRITADGDHFVIVLNETTLLDGHDSKHAEGVIGFQCQPGNPIEFRDVRLQPIRK